MRRATGGTLVERATQRALQNEDPLSNRLRSTHAKLDSWISEVLAEDPPKDPQTGLRRVSWAEEAAEPLVPSSVAPAPRPSGTYEVVELSRLLEGEEVSRVRRSPA